GACDRGVPGRRGQRDRLHDHRPLRRAAGAAPMSRLRLSRRGLVTSAALSLGGLALQGCDRITRAPATLDVLDAAEGLTLRAQRLLLAGRPLAREFSTKDISPVFKANGSVMPADPAYQTLMQGGFAGWRLRVDGLVRQPLSLSLDQLRALP